MNYNKTNLKLDKSQAIASIGQIELMNLFLQTFSRFKLKISQFILFIISTAQHSQHLTAHPQPQHSTAQLAAPLRKQFRCEAKSANDPNIT